MENNPTIVDIKNAKSKAAREIVSILQKLQEDTKCKLINVNLILQDMVVYNKSDILGCDIILKP